MMGDVGAVATLLNTVASWLLDKDGYAAWQRRRDLATKRKAVHDALDRNDFVAAHRLFDELRELASKP